MIQIKLVKRNQVDNTIFCFDSVATTYENYLFARRHNAFAYLNLMELICASDIYLDSCYESFLLEVFDFNGSFSI